MPGGEVPARPDAAQVDALAVGAGHVHALAQRLVRHDRHRRAHRAHGADRRAERAADLVGVRRAHLAAQEPRELLLVQLLVAADQREDRPGRAHVEQALDRVGRLDPEQLAHLGDGPDARAWRPLRGGSSGNAGAEDRDRASSTLAA